MISDAFSVLFGIIAIFLGAVFAWYGWTEQHWLALGVGFAFIAYGFLIARGGTAWLRLQPSSALRLYADDFSVGTKRYPYSEFVSFEVQRIRTRKTLNFIPAGLDNTVIAHLNLSDRVIKLRAGSGPSTIFGTSTGQSESDTFLQTLESLKWRAKQPTKMKNEVRSGH